MIQSELPRDINGVVTGLWKLRHRLSEFSAHFGTVVFANGETQQPVTGIDVERMIACFGEDIEVISLEGAEESPPVAAAEKPTSWADLERLTEEQLRTIAAELGCTDKRWKALRLRRYIADELGFDIPETDHVEHV